MVAPERETPGISANDCARPIRMPSRVDSSEISRSWRPWRSAYPSTSGEHDQHRADQPQVACAALDLVLEHEPQDPDRDRGDQQVPAQPCVRMRASRGSRSERSHVVAIAQISCRK